jgi:16S rRNA (uracil1498-N3)-methyltransferase
VRVTDGRGSVYDCSVARQSGDGAQLSVKRTENKPRSAPEVRVCAGLCDKEEFGELVQNLAALGAASIVPVVCEYCQAPWWQAWEKQEARLRKKMIAGIKQARSAWLPQLAPPVSLRESLEAAKGCPVLVADDSGAPLLSSGERVRGAQFVSCFVGPPGGFSPKEMAQFASAGAGLVSLSENRLRTELAAVVLCAAVRSMAAAPPKER